MNTHLPPQPWIASPQSPSDVFTPSPVQVDLTPLIDAIAANRAVVFVGAGASIPAGLPSWQQFLGNCLRKATASTPKPEAWTLTRDLLEKQGDHLMAAELLQKGLGSQLERYIWDDFSWAVKPSSIHQAIARIPFSLAITTNYDRLLETAYRHRPSVITWRSPLALFNTVKNGRFAVVKTHGDVGDGPSLVLTKTQYRDLIHLNEAFNSCLRTLLCYKTFLFVGYSLRDHDLLGLMDEARLTFGQDFGPHYAILFEDSVDHNFLRFLMESYSIHPIICRKTDFNPFTAETRTQAVVDVLRAIGGQVALRRQEHSKQVKLDGPLFCFPDACASVLNQALSLTGALRGDISMIRNDHFQALHILANGYQDDVTATKVPLGSDEPITHTGVVGSLFLRADRQRQFVYLKNVIEPEASKLLAAQNLPETKYEVCDSSVRSELACAVYADGRKIGVINIESEIPDAFSLEHLKVLRGSAEQIAAAFLEARQRDTSMQGLRRYFDSFKDFTQVMNASRALRGMDMKYLLWELDHNLGKLIPHWHPHDGPSSGVFEPYTFSEVSLAATVARDCARLIIQDVEDEIRRPGCMLAERGIRSFGIKGPISAMPIQVAGNLSGVLVSWTGKLAATSSDPREKILNWSRFRSAEERIFRLAHLVATDPSPTGSESRAMQFVTHANLTLKKVDKDREWDLESLRNRNFRHRINDVLLSSLLHPSIGMGRVRLWARCRTDAGPSDPCNPHFRCIASRTTKEYTSQGKKEANAYAGIITSGKDPFCHYTLARFKDDPYARHQDPGMFRTTDVNCTKLDKDENGSWVVGPIVRKGRLLGFLSGDNHHPSLVSANKPVDQVLSEAERSFQRSAVDVVTHMLAITLGQEVAGIW